MRILALGMALLLAIAVHAQTRLASYDALMEAATAGQTIRAVIDYSKTTISEDGEEVAGPAAIGGMSFLNWEQFAAGLLGNAQAYLAASETHLIGHPSYGFVYNYVRLRIYEDGKVEITARYLKPDTFEVVMETIYRGSLSDGTDDHGVSLFSSP